MKTKKMLKKSIFVLLLIFVIAALFSCKNSSDNNVLEINKEVNLKKLDSIKSENNPKQDSNNKNKKSIVISCGSGCAMVYDEENIISTNNSNEVKFKVKMYIDEVLTDTYYETYIFICDDTGNIKKINLKGKDDNLLESQLPEIKTSFGEYGHELCFEKKPKIEKSSEECIVNSNYKLPYSNKINIANVEYNELRCNQISGFEKFLCDRTYLRYISLPSFQNVKVILVPMDCSDFNYRYYLLTIFNNKIASSEYAEGEWYEPGDDNYKEITSFSIDENYIIEIKINSIESGKTTLKEESKFKISDKGLLEKLK
jgi:hypothetical protein